MTRIDLLKQLKEEKNSTLFSCFAVFFVFIWLLYVFRSNLTRQVDLFITPVIFSIGIGISFGYLLNRFAYLKEKIRRRENEVSFRHFAFSESTSFMYAKTLKFLVLSGDATVRYIDINKILSDVSPYFAGIFFASALKCIPKELLSKDYSVLEKSLKVLKTDEMTFKVFLAGVRNSRHPELADEIQEILKEKTNTESR